MEGKNIGTWIADPEQLTREGIRLILEGSQKIVIVGMAESTDELLQGLTTHPGQVVVVGEAIVHSPRVVEELRRHNIEPVLFCGSRDLERVYRALSYRIRSMLCPESRPQDVISAVEAAYRREAYLPSSMTTNLLAEVEDRLLPTVHHKSMGLSKRELEMLELAAQGNKTLSIAKVLDVSEKTVRNHLSNAYRKLGVSDRASAVALVVASGLVRPPALGRQGSQGLPS